MSENLFHVRTGMEESMLSSGGMYNCSSIDGTSTYWDMYASLTTVHNRVLYNITGMTYSGNNYEVAFNYHNLMTNDSTMKNYSNQGPYTYTSYVTDASFAAMIASDDALYVSYLNNAAIYKFPMPNFNSNYYEESAGCEEFEFNAVNPFKARGKMVWLNDHTICCAYANGFVFFDTLTKEFENHQSSITIDIADIAFGDDYIVATGAGSNTVLVYHIWSETFSTITLSSSNTAVVDYRDRKFYFAQIGALTVVSSVSMTIVDTIVGPWNVQPRQILVGTDALFVLPVSSVRLYIMDLADEEFFVQMLPFTFPAWNGVPMTCSVFQNTLFMTWRSMAYFVNYRGISKYQMGPVVSKEVISLPKSASSLTYNENFIKFDTSTYSFAHISNGTISKEFQYTDLTHTVKSVSMNKSEYRSIVGVSTTEKIHLENYIVLTDRYNASVQELFADYQELFDWLSSHYSDYDIVIGENVTTTTPSFTDNGSRIRSVEFKNPITEVPDRTFANCDMLERVRIPSTCKHIGYNAFYRVCYYNSNYFDINLSTSNVETIGVNAFMYVRFPQETLVLPDSLISIDLNAFMYNYQITGVKIGDNCTTIASAAFYECTRMVTFEIGSGIQSIGAGTFVNCVDLETITLHVAEDSVSGAPWNAPSDTQIIWDP